jgi:ADP-ribosylglycohydrolase/protein-tyrosine phosphatase
LDIYTSDTHPLQIAELKAGQGRIGITFLPGKKGSSIHGYEWNRDLSPDMEVIRRWGANAIVSLVEDHEFRWASVKNFPKAVEGIGAEWHHLPITDVHVPDDLFEARWTYHGHVLRERLRRGEKVLVHCRGGQGRAGTIAARLLIELGMDPDLAVSEVRRVRPGAIETSSQLRHVRACQRVDDDDVRSRALGCLFGGAIGDAFGYPVEFLSRRSIDKMYGPDGLQEPVFSEDGRWVVSDDTQMTLFTIEGARRAWGQDRAAVVESIRQSYLDWYITQHESFRDFSGDTGLKALPEMWEGRSPGGTCLSALRKGGTGTIETPINDSKGCGGVMRVAPLGVMGTLSPEECFWLAARAAALTHGHPSGYWSAGVLAAVVRRIFDGDPLRGAIEKEMVQLAGLPGADEVLRFLRKAVDPVTKDIAELGQGWVAEEALAMGVFAALHGRSMKEVLRLAANHDGDSDSTASIAGQIYGVMTGLEEIPYEWVRRLDVVDALCLVARA